MWYNTEQIRVFPLRQVSLPGDQTQQAGGVQCICRCLAHSRHPKPISMLFRPISPPSPLSPIPYYSTNRQTFSWFPTPLKNHFPRRIGRNPTCTSSWPYLSVGECESTVPMIRTEGERTFTMGLLFIVSKIPLFAARADALLHLCAQSPYLFSDLYTRPIDWVCTLAAPMGGCELALNFGFNKILSLLSCSYKPSRHENFS